MSLNNIVKTPTHLKLSAALAASMTALLSIVCLALGTAVLVYRTQCEFSNPENTSGSGYLFNILLRLYIQQAECKYTISWAGLTQSHTVFLMTCVTMVSSGLSLLASTNLILSVSVDRVRSLHVMVYVYVGLYIASLIIDIAIGTRFGMDYAHIGRDLEESSPGMPFNYINDMARLGAFVLMTLSLKGFMAHAINLVLVGVLLWNLKQFTSETKKPQHSIHALGALNGYMSDPPELNDTLSSNGSFMVQMPFSGRNQRAFLSRQPQPEAGRLGWQPFSYGFEPHMLPRCLTAPPVTTTGPSVPTTSAQRRRRSYLPSVPEAEPDYYERRYSRDAIHTIL